MVGTLVSVVTEVEAAVASGDSAMRVAMLRRMTDLFSDDAGRLNESQVAAFDEVILRLSRDVETRARVELSERLSDIANAPRKVVRHLAYDSSIDVAGPVLERSTRLHENDLVQIASERGQGHLFALSRRSSLTERVTDMLVTRGDQTVVRSVAGNDGAQFSELGFTRLTQRAREDEVLGSTLDRRGDIPPAIRAQLVALAEERARRTLSADFDAGAAASATARAARNLRGDDDDDLAAAIAIVDARSRLGPGIGVEEADVAAWIQEGKVTAALVGLARVAGVPPAMAVRAHRATHYDPLLFLVRSVRFGWGTLKLLLTAKTGKAPDADTSRSAFEAFQGLSISTAQRVVRFTAVREHAGANQATAA